MSRKRVKVSGFSGDSWGGEKWMNSIYTLGVYVRGSEIAESEPFIEMAKTELRISLEG